MQRNEQAQVGGCFTYFAPNIHYAISPHFPEYFGLSHFQNLDFTAKCDRVWQLIFLCALSQNMEIFQVKIM